jgi:tRNA U34 5-methylaminomethyl-2-thiouridine-forming methyltransferase MnmC
MNSDLCSKSIGLGLVVFSLNSEITHSICRQLSTENTDITLIETSDGSHSLFVRSLNETYHSRHGAVQESQWVFIKQGLNHLQESKKPRIHEVGFGTGLNALLAMRWAEEHQVHVHFTSLDTNVLPMEVAEKLNYCDTDISEEPEFERSREQLSSQQSPVPERSRGQEYRDRFLLMHSSPWNQDIDITPYFTLHKALREVQSEISESQFDVVFFDAFGPPTQPDMWTPDIFRRMFNALKPQGILVTYCAKGQVRRDMQSVGFTVERLPGPPGKREMLRATKPFHHE